MSINKELSILLGLDKEICFTQPGNFVRLLTIAQDCFEVNFSGGFVASLKSNSKDGTQKVLVEEKPALHCVARPFDTGRYQVDSGIDFSCQSALMKVVFEVIKNNKDDFNCDDFKQQSAAAQWDY